MFCLYFEFFKLRRKKTHTKNINEFKIKLEIWFYDLNTIYIDV